MPNSATETAAAPYPVAFPDSPVNVIVRLLKRIAGPSIATLCPMHCLLYWVIPHFSCCG